MKKRRELKEVSLSTVFALLIILFFVFTTVLMIVFVATMANIIVKLAMTVGCIIVAAFLSILIVKIIAKIVNWDISKLFRRR